MAINHQNNFATNLTSATSATDTTSPLNSIPTVDAPFYIAFDATNVNSHYEVLLCTSKTATHVNHAALAYDHTAAEEVRMVIPAAEMDALDTGWKTIPGTLAYSSADDPTYVVTTTMDLTGSIPVGARIKFTNNATTFYGIVTAIAAGTITLYGGTDYDVANSAITVPCYSIEKAPVGFPLDPDKWSVVTTDNANRAQGTPTPATWYNVSQLNTAIPIGSWITYYEANCDLAIAAGVADMKITLSTANNSESDTAMTSYFLVTVRGGAPAFKQRVLSLAAKTTYYVNISCTQANTNIAARGDNGLSVLKAICAYL